MTVGSNLKLAGLGIEALKSNFTRLSRPYKLNFAITYWCQSRCLTCNIWELKPKNELRLDEIQEFAKKNTSFRWLGITGGEPFMRSDIVEIIDAFRQNSKNLYLLAMPTNSLSNDEMVKRKLEKILELGVPKIVLTLSLDGYREMHDKVRGVPGNFDRVMNMARHVREMRKTHKNISFVFGYTMSKFNQGALERTYQEVNKELGNITYNDFHINWSYISGIYYNNAGKDVRADNEATAGELEQFIAKRKFDPSPVSTIDGAFLKGLVRFIRTGRAPARSRSLDASLFLDSYGNVYPSVMWDRKVGNIRDTAYDLGPIWSGAEANEVRKLISEGKEPSAWTACEAYQSLVGNVSSML